MIEILVVIAIIAGLAGLISTAAQSARAKADRAVAVSQMRQIGTALVLLAADQNGRLPGPMKSGQGSVYQTGKTDQLATVLGPYLGRESPADDTQLKIFLPPAFARAVEPENLKTACPFLLDISTSAGGQNLTLWGDDKSKPPMVLAAVPTSAWVICDADQLNPGVIGQPWADQTPKKIVHGKERLALYFDGSVYGIEEGALKPPPPPPPPPPEPPKPPRPPGPPK